MRSVVVHFVLFVNRLVFKAAVISERVVGVLKMRNVVVLFAFITNAFGA